MCSGSDAALAAYPEWRVTTGASLTRRGKYTGTVFFFERTADMSSAISDGGHLEFSQDDNMIRRLNELNIEWDEQTLPLSSIDLADNTYQTRFDTGSADEEFVLRYMAAYHNGDRLPMPLVVIPYSRRNVKDAMHGVCAGRHRTIAGHRAGAKIGTFLRAFPKHQGDIDALRDLSLFDNAANGKSISSDETYTYCADEVIRRNGGVHEGMPDQKFIREMFRRWDGRGVILNTLKQHIKATLAKQRCAGLGLNVPSGLNEHFAKLWSWERDAGFDSLAKAFCSAIGDSDVRKILAQSKSKRRSAAETLAEIAQAARGYRAAGKKMTPAAQIDLECRQIKKVLSRLDSDMSLDFAALQQIEEHIESLSAETTETIASLRAKIGGLVHA